MCLLYVSLTVIDILRKLADGIGVGQVQLSGQHPGSLHLPHDVTGSLLSFGHVSACQNHPSTCTDWVLLKHCTCLYVHIETEISYTSSNL